MVDSWRNFLKVEMFWTKLALMATWETYVFCAFHTFPGTHHFHIRSWSREERPLVRKSFRIFFHQLNRCYQPVPQSSTTSKACACQDRHRSHSSIVTSERTKRRTGAAYFPLSWSSSVVNLMPTTMLSSNSMKHTIRARDMPAIVN